MFDSFNYIFFWQMCGFTHIFCRSAVVIESEVEVQIIVSLYHICNSA